MLLTQFGLGGAAVQISGCSQSPQPKERVHVMYCSQPGGIGSCLEEKDSAKVDEMAETGIQVSIENGCLILKCTQM